ncbi:MAG TPA: hypothetical protein VM238_18580 [Phycisphaerae bacterium]|nr:hypothetical protein [Phycisphaerae bacterium]
MATEKRLCCFIPDEEQGKPNPAGCQNEAKWEIWGDPGRGEYTEACTDHVGALLDDSKEHRLFPI